MKLSVSLGTLSCELKTKSPNSWAIIFCPKEKKNLNTRTGFICTAHFKWGKLETALSDESHNVFCNVQCTQGTGNMLVDF